MRQPDPGGRPGTIPPVPGRPATPLLIAAVCGLLFSLITWQVLASGPLLGPDHALSRALVRTVPDSVTERLSDLGNIPVAVPVLALAMAYAAWRGRRLAAGAAGLAMALVPALVIPFKEWTARPGPLEPWAAGYFPSGHTATAAVAYLGAALLVRPYTRRADPAGLALAARRPGQPPDVHAPAARRGVGRPAHPAQPAQPAQPPKYPSKFRLNSQPPKRSQLIDQVIRPRRPGQVPWVW
ncbi:hypothetical protein [Streptomyces sp. NBC_00207]|uniref:hypothetical protein n=1 Tax=unclassified Streptomyces TaxID=2593676 RepID=UPI002886F64B|nr:hypothetical protein [Streptomyces sp. DSM 41633]